MKLHLDPRTKLFLILFCVLSAVFAPNLYFQFALVALIGLFSAVSGKWRYALRGILAYGLICVFTVWCMGVLTGTWRTMFVAFLGLVHKVYACGMLAGLVISTTKVGEFLSTILDEATANVDPENEKELMEAIQALTQEKTVIMIAHRLKTVRHADQILVVDKGQIVQRGTHEDLMAQDGIYRRFISGREKAVGWKL